MPLENIYCTRSDAKATRLRDDSRSVRERIRNGTARACREHTCCRRAMVAARNELVGLPTSWLRLEFAALTRAAPPLDSLGWHYQCQLSPPHTKSEAGIRCARPRARASCLGCCAVCGLCHEYCARACVCVRRFVHGWMAHVCVPGLLGWHDHVTKPNAHHTTTYTHHPYHGHLSCQHRHRERHRAVRRH